MESTYIAKKHWWFWVGPVFLSLITIWTIFLPVIILIYAFLRWKCDTLEIKNGCLQSRKGILFLDKKTIPVDQISFITEKCDIISEKMGFGIIQVQSSAFAKAIDYPFILNPSEFIKVVNDSKNK